MRITPLIPAALLSVLLSGCAEVNKVEGFFIPAERDAPKVQGYSDYLSARFAESEQDMGSAAKFYRASLKADPDNADLLALSFFYSTAAGDVDDAAKLAVQQSGKIPDDPAARLTLAAAAFKQGKFAEARSELTKSAKGDFATLTITLLDAWAAAGMGDKDAVDQDVKFLKAQHGAEALSVFHEALLYDFENDPVHADAAYRETLASDGPSPRLVEAYGRFLERNGRGADASALYQKLAGESSLAPIIAAANARIASGTKPAPMIASAGDGAAESLFGIAASLNDEASLDVSILYLRLALYLRPDLDLGSILLAARLESIEKYDDAVAVYRSIAPVSPYYRLAAVEIAIDELHVGNTDAAISELKALTLSDANDLEAWTALGDAYRSAERFDEAADAYDHAVKALGTPGKKDWPLFYARAIAEERAQGWDKAEADLKEALALSPDEPEVLNYLGYSWVDQGRNISEALVMLEKARALKPFDGYIVDSVGWAYYRLGRYGDAAKTLEDAVLLVPGDPTINDHFGDALWRDGKKLDARFQWSHALAFDPDKDEKSQIEKKLEVGLPAGDAHS